MNLRDHKHLAASALLLAVVSAVPPIHLRNLTRPLHSLRTQERVAFVVRITHC